MALLLSCHEETVRIGGIAPAAFDLCPDYAVVIDILAEWCHEWGVADTWPHIGYFVE